jgi:hypothetical protein
MRSQKFLFVPVLLLATAGLFSSCKKDNDAAAKNCHIITVAPATGDALNYTYNADGKLQSYSNGAITVTYGYNGNTIIANVTQNGAFSGKKIITVGANGFTANVKTENNPNGTSWSNDVYEYSGTQLIKATTTYSNGQAPDISVVTWTNGNLTSITSGNAITTVDYYLDKPGQAGDYLDLVERNQGIKIYKTKNLIKSMLTQGKITSFEYTFGNEGISALKLADGNQVLNYNYQYQCN